MDLNKGDLLTLNDNKKYVVVSSKKFNEKNYIYLIGTDDYSNIKFVEFDGHNKMTEVTDIGLIKELVFLFAKRTKNNN